MPPTSISSNATGLAIAEESSLKVLPGSPIWYALEPNSYTDLGAKYTTVARSPINATRQRSKGTQTDLEANAGFNQDLTQRNIARVLQGFFFSDAKEKPATQPFNGTQVAITSVTVGPNKYNGAAGLGVFLAGHLIYARNFGVLANNGLKVVSAAAGTSVTTTSAVAAEAAPPAAARFEAVGFEFAAGDLVLAANGGLPTLATTTTDFTTLGLNIGEWIYIGGDAAGNQFTNVVNKGYARIAAIAAHLINLELTTFTAVDDAGTGNSVRIFFGKVLLNAVAATDIKRRSYTIERSLGNDGVGTQAEYVRGAVANEVTINLQSNSKATIDMSFVGMDTVYNNGTTGLMAGTRVNAPGESAYNTSHDIYVQRLAVIDPASSNPTALYGYSSDVKFMVKNNVTGLKALGVLGSFEANAGDFEVSGTVTAYFASVDAAAAVKNNADVCLNTILAHENAGIVLDLPLLTLGANPNKVEKDKPVTVDLTQEGAKNIHGYTFLANFFDYLPTVAMPL